MFGIICICSAQFGGGEGTEDNPFIISRAAHLHNIRGDFLDAYFIQTNDLDVSPEALQDEDWYDREGGWRPIDWSIDGDGVQTVLPFTGVYDGGGFEIRGLTTNRPARSSQTLFFRAIGATIKNIRMVDVNVQAYRNNGGLVGNLEDGSLLLNCSSTGTVSSPQNEWIHGGLVGYALNSTIRNSYSSATVNSGGGRTGGLLGWSNGSTLINCYATGPTLPATAQVTGGLIGLIQRWGTGVGTTTMTHCYATGRVSGAGQMGGLVGVAQGQTITLSYWDTETTGMNTSSGGGIGRTTAEMTFPYGGDPRTFSEWDFEEVWVHDEAGAINNGYPYLFFQAEGGEFAGGEGTEESPWLISTPDHLNNIRNYLGEENNDKYFLQTADINLGVDPWAEGWEPIGSSDQDSFQGHYNGNNRVIYGLTVSEFEFSSLFGYAVLAHITNLGLEDVDITNAGAHSGALIGRGSGVTVKNCYAVGSLSSTGLNSAGFIGVIEADSQIEECWSGVDFTTSASQGAGFIGIVDRSTVKYCHNLGNTVATGEDVWYIAGFSYANFMGTIENSYVRGRVTTPVDANVVAGFVGQNLGTITNCYMTGQITTGHNDVGGFAAINDDTITNCYWNTQTTGIAISDGGIGRNIEQMTYPYAENTYVGWNFNEVWAPDAAYDINEGYPVLYYQYVQNFAGGLGTEDDPWQVETVQHLDFIREYLGEQNHNKYFIQTADINLNEAPWNIEEGWTPIGNNDNRFTGNYNGDSYLIQGLTIRRDLHHQGLFGFTDGAVLSNVVLKNVDITSGRYAGGLVGTASNSDISYCYVDGKISGSSYLGGITGQITGDSEITGCFSLGTIAGNEAETRVGGIAGYKAAANITDCYSVMRVVGIENYIGGIVGENASGSIIRSYVTGLVYASSPQNNVGGLVGGAGEIEVVNSFWNIHTTGQVESAGGGEGLSTPAMVTQATYQDAGWDFDAVWSIENGLTYPFLTWQEEHDNHNIPGPYNLTAEENEDDGEVNLNWQMVGVPIRYIIYRNNILIDEVNHPENEYADTEAPQMIDLTYFVTAIYGEGDDEFETASSNYAYASLAPGFAGGSGTEEDPFQVNSSSALNNVRFFLNAHFIQTNDIDLGVAPWNEGEGWVPLGSSAEPFGGSFNGDGFIISNLTINRISGSNALFGRTQGAVLENIHLRGVNINNSKADTGALAGYIFDNTTVRNCSSAGEIRINALTDRHIGGLVGDVVNSLITDSYSHVNITGGERAGGLAGWLNGGHARNSYATGNLNINGVSGGLVGLIQTWGTGVGNGTITNCYARGSVTGTSQIGGLVGTITVGGDIIENSYSTGRVVGNGGGLIGQSNQGNVAVNCYWDTETSEKDQSAGGAIGRLTRQMVYPYDLNDTYLRWDFQDVWREDSGYIPDQNPGINDGYVYLHFQAQPPWVLDTPEVVIEVLEHEGIMKAKLSWEPVEEANSYKIYAVDNPDTDNWGTPIDIVDENQFYYPITDNNRMFFKVIASAHDAP